MNKIRYRYYNLEYKWINFLILCYIVLFFSFTTVVALSPWWLIYSGFKEQIWGVEEVLMMCLLFLVGIPLSILYFYFFGYIRFMEKHYPQKMQIDKFYHQKWLIIYKKKKHLFLSGIRYAKGNISLYKRGNKPAGIEMFIKPECEADYFLENDQVHIQLVFSNTVIDLEKELLEYVTKVGTSNISYFQLSLKYPNEAIMDAFYNSDTVTVVYTIEGYDGFDVTYDITGFKDVYDMMLNYLPEMSREDVKYDL